MLDARTRRSVTEDYDDRKKLFSGVKSVHMTLDIAPSRPKEWCPTRFTAFLFGTNLL